MAGRVPKEDTKHAILSQVGWVDNDVRIGNRRSSRLPAHLWFWGGGIIATTGRLVH